MGIRGIHVASDTTTTSSLYPTTWTVEDAVAIAPRHVPYTYAFDDVEYLRSKNAVDKVLVNRDVWRRVGRELKLRWRKNDGGEGGR